MSDINEYKCPSCGGAIEFDSHSQKMKCPYCDTEFDLETLKKYDEQLSKEAEQKDDISDWQTDPGKQWQEGETDGMNVYTCNPAVVRSYRMRIQVQQAVLIVGTL